MMRIQSLLNPPSETHSYRQSVHTQPASKPRTFSPPAPPPKRQKLAKDAPVFARNKTKGAVRYPPYEAENDRELLAQYKRFQVFPMGHIAEYCRHIPYNSEKKSFLAKTGREAFEVFQYTFKSPVDDREYTVMWDYNIGLVRITPFFKCCKYSKTTPARVLNLNPGLRDISHSITGGALAAQGYWMPFESAKAVAATFCYEIRYALTPLFGKEFPSMCTLPRDPSFACFRIDKRIVRQCTLEAENWRHITHDPQPEYISRPAAAPAVLATPPMTLAASAWAAKSQNPRPAAPQRSTDIESGYGTDTDRSDRHRCSPQTSPPKQDWTAVNHRYRGPLPSRIVEASWGLAPPNPWLSSVPSGSRGGGEDGPAARPKRALSLDENYADDETSATSSSGGPVSSEERRLSAAATREAKAAQLMMQLSVADASLKGGEVAN